jgi:hypothetical protein
MADIEVPNPDDIEELKANTITKVGALTVAAFAVLLAVTSLGGSNAGKEVLLNQQQASNQWAYYQAKAIRENMYRLDRMRLEMDLAERGPSMSQEAKSLAMKFLQECTVREGRYETEKMGIEKAAKENEAVRDLNMKSDPYFDYGETLLQIAIVIASVAMLAGSWWFLGTSVIVAAAGAFLSADGFFMFWEIPGL